MGDVGVEAAGEIGAGLYELVTGLGEIARESMRAQDAIDAEVDLQIEEGLSKLSEFLLGPEGELSDADYDGGLPPAGIDEQAAAAEPEPEPEPEPERAQDPEDVYTDAEPYSDSSVDPEDAYSSFSEDDREDAYSSNDSDPGDAYAADTDGDGFHDSSMEPEPMSVAASPAGVEPASYGP